MFTNVRVHEPIWSYECVGVCCQNRLKFDVDT